MCFQNYQDLEVLGQLKQVSDKTAEIEQVFNCEGLDSSLGSVSGDQEKSVTANN